MAVEKVTFGDNLPGYEIGDKGLPAVVVVQEWWGVAEHIKDIAALISSLGFRALIPDLYKGKLGANAEEAHHLMANLDFPTAVKEIGQATKYLLDTGAPKVGIIGFCMGGALALAAGQHVPELAAIVPCYGIPDARYFQVEAIKAPVLGVYGGKDKHVDFAGPAAAAAMAAKINGAGGNATIHIAPNAPHGFLNQVVPSGVPMVEAHQGYLAPEEEVAAAWQAATDFLKAHLH